MSTLVCPKCRLALQAEALVCPSDGAAGEPQAFPALPGPLAQRFHVLSAFGHTAHSALFLAESQTSGRRGVLKLALDAGKGHDPEAHRARRELERQQKLVVAQLASPWESGLADGRTWLFRRLLTGETLRARLDRKAPIPLGAALRIAGECGIALEALHAQGLLHRDLHPGHVFLETVPGQPASAERIVVMDAGLPRIRRRDAGPAWVGTPGYAAPEQLQGTLITVRSDLYSLGVMLAEMLQGTPVFSAGDPDAILQAQLCDAPLTLSDSFPESVRAMIGALLRSDPQRRPLSAQKLRTTLDAYLLEGVPVTREPNSHSTSGEPGHAPAPADHDASRERHRSQPSAAPPPPPAAAMRSARPPAQHGASPRPATRAPLPPPPTRKPEDADRTQQLDEQLLEELVPPARSMPPPPMGSIPPKPPRSTQDNTVPVRLDQILAVSKTPRTSAVPPPSPPMARSLPLQVSVMATSPAEDQGLESLLFGDVPEDNGEELPPHAGTLFDPGATAVEEPAVVQAAAPVAEPTSAPAQTSLGLPAPDTFAPVAPHKATSLGLPNPVHFAAEQLAQAAQASPQPTGAAAAFALDLDDEDDLEGEGEDQTTIFRSDPPLDLSVPGAIVPPPGQASLPASAAFNAANVAKLPPRDESGDDHTQPVRELQSSVRPAEDDSPRKRYLGLGLAAAAALLLGVGGRALLRGGDESAEATEPGSGEDAPQEVGSAATAEPTPSNSATEQVPMAAPQLADIDGPDEGADAPAVAAVVAPAGAAPAASVAPAAIAQAEAPASSDLPARPGAPVTVTALGASTPVSVGGEIRPVTTSPLAPSADSRALEVSSERHVDQHQQARVSAAKPSTEATSAEGSARASRRKKAEKTPPSATPAAGNQQQQAAWTEARDEARGHYAARRYQKAAEAYERATRLDPRNPGTFAGLGAARLQLQNAKGAVEAYQQAVQLSPDTPGFHAALGRAYVAAGDEGRARASYKRALALDPDNANIAKALADLD